MEYCNNENCPYKNKCPKYVYINKKITSEFWLVIKDPKECGFKEEVKK